MAKILLTTKINLEPLLGEGHTGDYLAFKPLTFKDGKELGKFAGAEDGDQAAQLKAADGAIDLLRSKFVGGKITDEESNQQVEVQPEDFDELPITVLRACMTELSGGNSEDFTRA